MGKMKSIYMDQFNDPDFQRRLDLEDLLGLCIEPDLPDSSWESKQDSNQESVLNPEDSLPF